MWRWPFIVSLAISISLVVSTVVLTRRLASRARGEVFRRSMVAWSIKGLLLPLVLWILMNVGLSFTLQPFMPSIQAAQNSGASWLPAFMRVLAAGLFVISSYWAATTLIWRLWVVAAGMDEEGRRDFRVLCQTCFGAMVVPAIIIVLIGGWKAVGLALSFIAGVTAGYAASISRSSRMPMYSRALARIKFGKYAEAEWEIISELEKCDDDFDGWMMMADLYANHFNDLGEAQNTIAEICEQPKITPSQLSVALHRLADWHLKLADDPEGARVALQVICDRLRGTHLARMAQLRINQLPRSSFEARERRTGTLIPLPALTENLEAPAAPVEATALQQQDARAMAQDCVTRLQNDPNDAPAREKLARLFAEHLDRVDLGIEQLTLLLDMPEQPDGKRAEWLSLIAVWHLRYRQDKERGRRMLEKLIEDFPDYPQAMAARRRLEALDRESGAR